MPCPQFDGDSHLQPTIFHCLCLYAPLAPLMGTFDSTCQQQSRALNIHSALFLLCKIYTEIKEKTKSTTSNEDFSCQFQFPFQSVQIFLLEIFNSSQNTFQNLTD